MTSICLLFGANGSLGRKINLSALEKYDHVFPFDITTSENFVFCDLAKPLNFSQLFSFLSFHHDLTHIDLIFSQRPFLNLEPHSFADDVHQAIDITCLAPVRIIEYFASNYPDSFKSASFLGSINSTLVCDQPLSYMISKCVTDVSVRFLSNRFPNHCFRNFILGLVDVPAKSNAISNNPQKLDCAYASVGKHSLSTDQELASTIVENTLNFCLPMSGSFIYLDNGQHFTDPFWSARLTSL